MTALVLGGIEDMAFAAPTFQELSAFDLRHMARECVDVDLWPFTILPNGKPAPGAHLGQRGQPLLPIGGDGDEVLHNLLRPVHYPSLILE